MPTFTTIALDRLIEPKASKRMAEGKIASDSTQGSQIHGTDNPPGFMNSTKSIERKHHWTQISPALYATPEPTPVPDSPSSFVPSPYIVNHKRRGPRLSKTPSEDDIALVDGKANEMVRSLEAGDVESCRVINVSDIVHNTVEDGHAKCVVNGEFENKNISNEDAARQDTSKSGMLEGDSEMDDFFDPQDSSSDGSSTRGESYQGLEQSLNLDSSVSEFYDAWEDLSSESGSQALTNDVETELHELRLSLLMETEKRKQVEDQLAHMLSQWKRIRDQLSTVGLYLPSDPTILENPSADDPVEELSRQVQLIRFVSNSIGRGVAKAELGAEMESQLESKKFEIARLLDRLHYYEAVNHEMSQRNQETIETMRRLRQRRKRRQRWVWGSIVAAATVGSAALLWSYLPTGNHSTATDPSPSHKPETSRSA